MSYVSTKVPDTSVDALGISDALGRPTGSSSTQGSLWSVLQLAAGTLNQVIPISEQRALLCFSSSWRSGTPSSTTPGAYTSYSTESRPTFFFYDYAGNLTPVVERGGDVGYLNPVSVPDPTSIRLLAATSHNSRVFFLISNVVNGATVYKLLIYSLFRDKIVYAGQHTLPSFTANGLTIKHGAGLAVQGNHLLLFMTDSAGAVYTCRCLVKTLGLPQALWMVSTDRGWTRTFRLAKPLQSSPGSLLTDVTTPSVSGFQVRQRFYLSVLTRNGGVNKSAVYDYTNYFKPGRFLDLLDLGTDAQFSGPARFAHIPTNPSNPLVQLGSQKTSLIIPWHVSKYQTNNSPYYVDQAWNVLLVPRV